MSTLFAALLYLVLLVPTAASNQTRAGRPTTLPRGTVLYLRLDSAVSTRTSHLRGGVAARVLRDVLGQEGVVIPVGAVLRGQVEKLIPSSSPTDRARLGLGSMQLELPGMAPVALAGHLVEVENARESVLPDGTILGVLASELPLTHLEDALERMRQPLPSVGVDLRKTSEKALGKGDVSIEFSAGTDFQWVLDEPLVLDAVFPPVVGDRLAPGIIEPLERMLAEAPQRAASMDGKPGDPLNLILIGNPEEVRGAFQQAGWAEAEKLTGKSLWETVRAIAASKGYSTAPVSQLYLFGRAEELAFQKMLNTFAKRHHLRLWRSPAATADGREIWLGAATHDTGWDIRPGVVSHAIDPEIDKERDKVGADLAASGRVSALRLIARPAPLSEGLTATGAAWRTDGQLLAIELKLK